jgi:hypothetical protein
VRLEVSTGDDPGHFASSRNGAFPGIGGHVTTVPMAELCSQPVMATPKRSRKPPKIAAEGRDQGPWVLCRIRLPRWRPWDIQLSWYQRQLTCWKKRSQLGIVACVLGLVGRSGCSLFGRSAELGVVRAGSCLGRPLQKWQCGLPHRGAIHLGQRGQSSASYCSLRSICCPPRLKNRLGRNHSGGRDAAWRRSGA